MFLGVLYGILGCSLWGFIYIIPLLLPEYSPATVAMGRFTVYSIGSLVICYYCRKTLALLTTSDWIKAFCLGFFGNAVYYVLLTKGVRLAGVPTSGMLMALIPLNVALLTNRPGAETTVVVPWRRLSLPLAMILIGLWIGNIDELILKCIQRRKATIDRRPRPAVCTFDAIGPRQTDTYVCFEGVRFTEAGPWCDTDPETSEPQTSERTLTDAQGRTFRVRTLGTCAYATEPVPQGTGSVYGIIDYFNGKYTLRVSERRVEFANAAGLPRAYPSTGKYSAPKPTK